jgi:glycosyltransferase involved in cell wall biosynthesis
MPRFSVIIPLYNKEKDLEKTLESLLAQSFTDFEVIIANDGSTDGSETVVKSFTDNRINYFNKKNEGVAFTRNFAVAKATSPYIAFLDADDYWYPKHLENLNKLTLKFPDTNWFATAYEKKHHKTLCVPVQSQIMKQQENWMGIVPNYFENSLIDALAWTSAVGMKKDFFEALNGFDTTITNGAGEDTDLWIRAALKSPVAFSTQITAQHNLQGSNRISHTPTKNRVFMNPNNFLEEEKTNPSLKKYLDLNRYSFALQHKMAGDTKAYKNYLKNIDPKNLTAKQKFILNKPTWILKGMFKIQQMALQAGFRISSFK